MTNTQWIILLITIFILYKLYVWQEAIDRDKRWGSPTPPPTTHKKKDISPPPKEREILIYRPDY